MRRRKYKHFGQPRSQSELCKFAKFASDASHTYKNSRVQTPTDPQTSRGQEFLPEFYASCSPEGKYQQKQYPTIALLLHHFIPLQDLFAINTLHRIDHLSWVTVNPLERLMEDSMERSHLLSGLGVTLLPSGL